MTNKKIKKPREKPQEQKKNSNLVLVVVFIALCILLWTLLPSGSKSSSSNSSQKAYTVTLICTDCAAESIEINVWQNAGKSRGSVSFSVPHNTIVNVVDSKTADDGRIWYKVNYGGKSGWIAQDFVRR